MLVYAAGVLEFKGVKIVGKDPNAGLLELLTRVLIDQTEDLFQRPLHRSYLEFAIEGRIIKGKLDIAKSVTSGRLFQGIANCTTEEMSRDVPENQIIKSTINMLLGQSELKPKSIDDLSCFLDKMKDVSLHHRPWDLTDRIRTTKLNQRYEPVLRICELILSQLIPNDKGTGYQFESFDRSEAKLRKVFETFVRSFYRIELKSKAHVTAKQLDWDAYTSDTKMIEFLPTLKTDATIIFENRTLIVETKYVPELLKSGQFGKDRFRSPHLYQLMSYLQAYKKKNMHQPSGLLLYPTCDRPLYATYKIFDFDISIATIDLTMSWESIANSLLALTSEQTDLDRRSS
jgi:5-methylcytosine-specific restriction enzyme subunit McrC